MRVALRRHVLALAALGYLLAACSQGGSLQLERTAYLAAGEQARIATDQVLDVLAPYERINELKRTPKPLDGKAQECVGDQNLDPKVRQATVTPFRGYCDARRSAFATIGDPPLVAATRRLSDTIGRFDRVVTAYASGASFRLVRSDIEVLSETLGGLAEVVKLVASPAGAVADAAVDVAAFQPILDQADRAAMRDLIKLAGPTIDEALKAMALSAETHFGQVFNGQENILQLDRTRNVTAAQLAALVARTARIRTLLANWVALIEQQRAALTELRNAAENPNRIETRLGDIEDETAPAIRLKADVVSAMAADLGTGLPITAVALEAQ